MYIFVRYVLQMPLIIVCCQQHLQYFTRNDWPSDLSFNSHCWYGWFVLHLKYLFPKRCTSITHIFDTAEINCAPSVALELIKSVLSWLLNISGSFVSLVHMFGYQASKLCFSMGQVQTDCRRGTVLPFTAWRENMSQGTSKTFWRCSCIFFPFHFPEGRCSSF